MEEVKEAISHDEDFIYINTNTHTNIQTSSQSRVSLQKTEKNVSFTPDPQLYLHKQPESP